MSSQQNPQAAGVLYWEPLHRQVRIEGKVETVSEAESAAYFRTRPRDSRISAWASPQSQPIQGRAELERLVAERGAGGSRASTTCRCRRSGAATGSSPTAIEFWQGQPNRLHDRVRYELADGRWRRERLAPY